MVNGPKIIIFIPEYQVLNSWCGGLTKTSAYSVMKSNSPKSGFIFLARILAFTLIVSESYAQNESKMVLFNAEDNIYTMPKAGLRQSLNDTVLPTLSNSGHGLVKFEIIIPQQDQEKQGIEFPDGRNPMVLRQKSYTQEQMKTLQEQKQLMEDQFIYEWHKQVRKERMDLNLGEVIKGFYSQPVFP